MDVILEYGAAFLTLTLLEIVLGIDNIIFLSILVSKLPEKQRPAARFIGLGLAMGLRIVLLLFIFVLARLTEPLVTLLGHEFSLKDLIMIGGGLFLLAKATQEIHEKLEGEEGPASGQQTASFSSVIVQVVLLDVVFSLDSVLTAIGMAGDKLVVMIAAVVVAVIVMMLFAKVVSEFVQRHPTVKMLALSFLLLVGFALAAEGLEIEIPRGYLYFAIGFSVFVEALNLQVRKRRDPVHLRRRYTAANQSNPGQPNPGQPNPGQPTAQSQSAG